MVLSVPFVKQETTYTCGPTTLQMIFRYHGREYDQRLLLDWLKTDEVEGTPHAAMVDAVRHAGFHCYVNNHSSLDEIAHFLTRYQLPSIVYYIEPDTEVDHYAVVVGVTDDEVILNDPWNGERFELSKEEFLKRWRGDDYPILGENAAANRWILVVSPNSISVGRSFSPLSIATRLRRLLPRIPMYRRARASTAS
jgi:ABC-type bacteriocin/lantibiotic exporter with double-glycine peptidase domain